jgi:hypothetical protein
MAKRRAADEPSSPGGAPVGASQGATPASQARKKAYLDPKIDEGMRQRTRVHLADMDAMAEGSRRAAQPSRTGGG